MKNKILITGSSGFVGTNITKSFKNTYDLILPNRNNLRKTLDLKKNYDVMIHLAGLAHDTSSTAYQNNYFEINTDLTVYAFEKFMKSNAQIFIFLSSVKACSDSFEGVLNENVVSRPSTPYGKSKLKAENIIIKKLKKSKNKKKIYILRPSMIHGANNKGNLNLLFKIINWGIPWPLGLFDNRRSFCGIDNLIFVIKKIIETKNIRSGIYNVADDDTISTNELYKIICRSLKRKECILKIPKVLIKLIALIGDYFPIPLNTDRLNKLTENYVVSNSKIRKELNIKSLPDSVRDSFHKTLVTFM